MKRFNFLLFFLGICSCCSANTISLCSSHAREERWEGHSLNAQERQELLSALTQRYRYLNAGAQSMAYLSQDEKYVIKFFKSESLSCKAEGGFFSRLRLKHTLEKRALKRDRIFSAYKLACDKLPQETGVLYVHFNQTQQWKEPLALTDAAGNPFSIELDNCDFIMQRKALSMRGHFDALHAAKDTRAAKESFERLLKLSPTFFHKGMRNRDIEFVNNYGFIDGAPVLFDVGRLQPCIDEDGKQRYQNKLKRFLPAFREWIRAFYPLFVPACDEAIEAFQDKSLK